MKRHYSKRFTTYAWFVVFYTILTILWGAYVRATGSGAGCGSHWPTCNGDIIPRPEMIETVIEYTHRLSSALMGPMLMVLLGWSWKVYGRQSLVTKAALWAFIFVLIEGALGAGLVLFGLVDENISLARAIVMGVHLINTLVLLGFITLAAWWSMGEKAPTFTFRLSNGLLIALLGIMIVGAFGAITAMGDTLFPAESFIEGAAAKFEPGAHFAVKMRTWHPVVAVAFAVYTGVLIYTTNEYWADQRLRFFAISNLAVIGVQLAAGVINVLLAAPIWMQLVHLALADISWILLLLMFIESSPRTEVTSTRFINQNKAHLTNVIEI